MRLGTAVIALGGKLLRGWTDLAPLACGGPWKRSGRVCACFSVWMAISFMIMYRVVRAVCGALCGECRGRGSTLCQRSGIKLERASCSSMTLDCSASSTDISSYVKNAAPPGLSTSSLGISTSWPGTTSSGTTCDTADGTNSPNCIVQVTVSYNLSFPLPFIATASAFFPAPLR